MLSDPKGTVPKGHRLKFTLSNQPTDQGNGYVQLRCHMRGAPEFGDVP